MSVTNHQPAASPWTRFRVQVGDVVLGSAGRAMIETVHSDGELSPRS
jgi:hypothetical protein